jgi:hypothetical protein
LNGLEIRKEILLSLGMFSLTISIILGNFLPERPLITFLEGIFTGLSLVMNISYLIKNRKEKNIEFNLN